MVYCSRQQLAYYEGTRVLATQGQQTRRPVGAVRNNHEDFFAAQKEAERWSMKMFPARTADLHTSNWSTHRGTV